MHNTTWGMLIVVYLFLGGISAGASIVAGTSMILGWTDKIKKAGAYLAPFPVMLGLLLLIFDLHRPLHFYQLLLNYNPSSVMSWGVIALFVFAPVSLATAWFNFKGIRGNVEQFLGIANIILGLGIGAYTGLLLAAVSSNPVWGSALIPALFTVSALSTGICGTILLAGIAFKAGHAELAKLASLDLVAILVELLIILILIVFWLNNVQSTSAAEAMLTGKYGIMFWLLVVGTGLIMPLFIIIYELKIHGRAPGIVPYVSAAMVLFGGFFLRYVMVYAGQSIYPFLGQY